MEGTKRAFCTSRESETRLNARPQWGSALRLPLRAELRSKREEKRVKAHVRARAVSGRWLDGFIWLFVV